jgi:hypothetical protein
MTEYNEKGGGKKKWRPQARGQNPGRLFSFLTLFESLSWRIGEERNEKKKKNIREGGGRLRHKMGGKYSTTFDTQLEPYTVCEKPSGTTSENADSMATDRDTTGKHVASAPFPTFWQRRKSVAPSGGKLVGSFSNQNKVIRTDTRHV